MKNILKNAMKILIILTITCTLSGQVDADYIEKPPHFDLINSLDNKFVKDLDVVKEFLRKDKEYLSEVDERTLKEEITLFDQLMYESKMRFKKTKQGVLLYSSDAVGEILVYDRASENRKNLLEARKKGEEFEYRDDRYYFPGKTVRVDFLKSIDEKNLKIAYDEVERILDRLDIPKGILENTLISISPFKIRGMNGFTETYGLEKEGITMVIGVDIDADIEVAENLENFKNDVRTTLLHELGHVFHEQNMRKTKDIYNLEEGFWKEYSSYYNEELNFDYMETRTRKNWRNDIRENLAEDFRIYYSGKIEGYDFNPKEKRTNGVYNPNVEEFFKKYETQGKKSEKLSLWHSTVRDGDIVYSLDDYSIRDIENSNGLDIRIQNKKKEFSKDSYIKFWRRGNEERSERIILGADENTNIHLDKNSDINIIIKYEKIADEYIAVWRLNIK